MRSEIINFTAFLGLWEHVLNIPVQVDGRIVDCVDPQRAAVMACAPNVRVVKERRTRNIVRVIVDPMVLGKGDVNVPTSHMDSRRGHKKDILFNTDDAPTGDIAGMPFVFVPKTIPVLGVRSERREKVKPPTSSRRTRRRK